MKKYLLFLLIIMPMVVLSQGLKQQEQTDDIHLIDPVYEGDPMTTDGALKFREENYNNWGIPLLGFDQIIGTGPGKFSGKGISICTCDTGLPDHDFYKYKITGAENFTSSTTVADKFGHATHVAGIEHEIAKDADLYFAKVLNDQGSGSTTGIVAGIDWCISKMKPGKGVINMSLGGPSPMPTVKAAIDRANAAGIVVVCAAGNSGQGGEKIGWPGAYENVICVGSIDETKLLSYFSSSGATGDVCAPGGKILSTYLNNTWQVKSGTSMASPFVAGVVALILEQRGNSGKIESELEETCNDILPPAWDENSFWGYVTPRVFDEAPVDPGPDPEPDPDKGWWARNITLLLWIGGGVALLLIVVFGLRWMKRNNIGF